MPCLTTWLSKSAAFGRTHHDEQCVTLWAAEDQVKHAISGIAAIEAHHHLTAPGHAICLPAALSQASECLLQSYFTWHAAHSW